MKIITQLSTFDYNEIKILGDLERCKLLIDNVPDEKIVNALYKIRGKGRNEYSIEAVWNSILIMPLIECSGVEQLRRELSRNRDLRRLCGFNDSDYYYGKSKLVPPAKAYTNMFKNLKKIEPMLKECFNELRQFMYETLKDFGVNVGEDGKIFSSKAKHPNTNGDVNDARCDMDADYTKKETYYRDKDGKTQVKTKTYFGFRVHILADTDYELPIEYTVTKASKSERKELIKHINMLSPELREKISTLSADKGYDDIKTIEFLRDNEIKAVIDIRNFWKDENTKQYRDTNIVYNYKGEVGIITEDGEYSALKYLGYDKIKDTLRYTDGKKVYSIELNEDRRVFTQIARDSQKWQRIYKKRTALERINGRLDRDFNLENHKVRGLAKATVLVDIMMIGMLAMAKGHIINKQEEKIRCLKS